MSKLDNDTTLWVFIFAECHFNLLKTECHHSFLFSYELWAPCEYHVT